LDVVGRLNTSVSFRIYNPPPKRHGPAREPYVGFAVAVDYVSDVDRALVRNRVPERQRAYQVSAMGVSTVLTFDQEFQQNDTRALYFRAPRSRLYLGLCYFLLFIL
jgi:hypothetical protein